MGPGWTVHVGLPVASSVPVSTTTPAWASMSIVMSMWGLLGTDSPVWTMRTPSAKRAPTSSSPETNWLEPEASMRTSPPVGAVACGALLRVGDSGQDGEEGRLVVSALGSVASVPSPIPAPRPRMESRVWSMGRRRAGGRRRS